MSVYFETKKQKFIVRKYIRGTHIYIGQFDTKEAADEAEGKWVEDARDQKAEEKFMYSLQWFEAESKRQVKELHKQYPGYIDGKPGKASRESEYAKS